jgi:hypothetical protein
MRHLHIAIAVLLPLVGCQTPESAFVGDRLQDLCDGAYYICNVPAGCVLDEKHYVEGRFPGAQRVVLATDKSEVPVQVRIFFSAMEAPGTELLVQLYEPDCIIDKQHGSDSIENADIFEKAGDDATLIFDLKAQEEGEHLLEVYSDTSADFLLLYELNKAAE